MSYQPPAPAPMNGWAIAALITGLCSLIIAPIVCGHIALRQIARRGDRGSWMAIIGLIFGYVQLLVAVGGFITLVGLGWWGISQS